MVEIGQRLRELRTSKAMSQAELASVVGVHQTTISFIERDEKQPSLDVALRIAKSLGVSIDDLLTPESEPAHAA